MDAMESAQPARAALAAGDAGLAAADGALAEILRSAHLVATESARRIDAVRAEIEAAAGSFAGGTPAARELGRFLASTTREIGAVVAAAQAEAAAKTVAVQQLAGRYRGAAQP